MLIKREKSVVTCFDFKNGAALPIEGIQYAGEPLTGLAADETFAYLGVLASLVSVFWSWRRAPRLGTGATPRATPRSLQQRKPTSWQQPKISPGGLGSTSTC